MDERGFTLVELLVVVLVIGILAAIALPTFLGQRAKAQDATTKSDVRNAVSQMESCFRSYERYSGCPDSESALAEDVVATVDADGAGYLLQKQSQTMTLFRVRRTLAGYVRSCDVPDEGGCGADGSW